MPDIGRSTDPSTATQRLDISGSEPASIRYCNPGAQYPSARAARFGQLGYGIIGGGHKIAVFPSPVNGAAANLDLLARNYVGMAMGAAGQKWTGSYGFGIPGYTDDLVLTRQMVDDPTLAIAILKAIAGREAGRGDTLTEEEWHQAHAMFRAGSADAYLSGATDIAAEEKLTTGPSGAGLVRRARAHIGEEYRNRQVPKNDPEWKGPWDCAEFVSWLVYQEAGVLYGCTDNNAKPATADAYTGAWRDDVERRGIRVSVDLAASTTGGIVLRYPPAPDAMGHIAICDGQGGTIEAKGLRFGVVADTVHDRHWDTGILIPGISYDEDDGIRVREPAVIYRRDAPNMNAAVIAAIQRALAQQGFFGGPVDGQFNLDTQAAVIAFQKREGLVVDGEVGANTAAALGVSLITAAVGSVLQPGGVGTGSAALGGVSDLFKSFDPKILTSIGLGVGSMNPFVMLAAQILPAILQAVVGDKGGAVAENVAKTVKAVTGADTAEAAAEKLKVDAAAVAQLQIKLAEIAAAQEEAKQRAQFAVLQAQFQAEADKRKSELESIKLDRVNTNEARAALQALAGQGGALAWTAPALSYLVTIGFFFVLVLLLLKGHIPGGNETLQIVNIVIGALTAAFATVVNFWLGSSQSSRVKDVMAISREENQVSRDQNAPPAQPGPDTTKSGPKPKPRDQFDRCLDVILSKESPTDAGGPTKYGLTMDDVARALRKPDISKDDYHKLTRIQAGEVYRVHYWNVLRCDELPAGVDLVILDIAVETDVVQAAKLLQKVVGAGEDGSVGPVTLGAAGLLSPRAIITGLSELRRERLRNAQTGVCADNSRIDDIDKLARAMIDRAAE